LLQGTTENDIHKF